jgi:hypothetical protein
VRPAGIVVEPPGFNDPPCHRQATEQVLVEALVAEAPVEALDKSVLDRLSGREIPSPRNRQPRPHWKWDFDTSTARNATAMAHGNPAPQQEGTDLIDDAGALADQCDQTRAQRLLPLHRRRPQRYADVARIVSFPVNSEFEWECLRLADYAPVSADWQPGPNNSFRTGAQPGYAGAAGGRS